MHPVIRIVIESAMADQNKCPTRDAALDEIYVKMIVRPLQLAWLYKTKKCDCCYAHD
jgi:hypothetical protein